MLKGLFLSLKGKLRQSVNENTDLRTAGLEQNHNNVQLIESVRDQRNEIATSLVLLRNELKEEQSKLSKAHEAFKHWNAQGDKIKEDTAYDLYCKASVKVSDLQNRVKALQTNVENFDIQIEELESESDKAKTTVEVAAGVQQLGRAKRAVESAHKNITTGPLAGAIEAASRQDALADVTKEERKGRDHSDVLDIGKSVPSREDLLAQ